MKLLQEDLLHVIRALPGDVKRMMKKQGIILGGGFIREVVSGEKPNDIDLFGASLEQLERVAGWLETDRGKQARVLKTKNAITLVQHPRRTVQFITRWLYDEPQKCLESFDFTVCQAVVWWEDGAWQSAIADTFYPDLASRRLRYTRPQRNEDAGGSLLRMRKFIHRGYHISADEMAKVIARMTVAVTAHERFEEIRRDEREQSRMFRAKLREVDPLYVVDGITPVDLDEEEEGEADEESGPFLA